MRRTACRWPDCATRANDVPQADMMLMYLQHGVRVTKRNVMLSNISDNELLSATQLIESTKDLWPSDVSVDELVCASCTTVTQKN